MSRTDENKAALQKLRISLTGACVEKVTADRVMFLVERLQQDDCFAPEVLAIGEELACLFAEIDAKAKQDRQDVVAEMCASVIRCARLD